MINAKWQLKWRFDYNHIMRCYMGSLNSADNFPWVTTYCYNTSSFSNFAEKNYFKHFMWFFFLVKCWIAFYTKISLWTNRLTMQGLPVLTLLLHVIVLAQCQYCSCIYILLPRNSVFPLNSSRPTFLILAAASIYI